MGRSASGSPYAAPKAPNAPQGTNDYSYLSGIYGASYGRKKAAADFTRPTLLARPVSPVENLITTVADTSTTTPPTTTPPTTTPPTDTGSDTGKELDKEDIKDELDKIEKDTSGQDADDTTGDIAKDNKAFENYLDSDEYVQTTAGGGSTTMGDAANDKFDTTVTDMSDQTTLTGGAADTEDDGTVTTMKETITLTEGAADTSEDVVTTMDEVPTMDEYLDEIADQDARDRVKFEDLLQTNVLSGKGLLSIREYNNLIQNRIKALDKSTMTVTADQLREEQLEIERLQGLTEKNALETAYQDYVDAYNERNFSRTYRGITLPEGALTQEEFNEQLYDPDLGMDKGTAYAEYIGSFEGLTRDRDGVTVISDPPKETDEVVADISKPALSQAEFGGTFEEYQDYIGDYQSKLMDSTLSGAEMNELLSNATLMGRGQYADDFYFNNPNEVVTAPEGTQSTVSDEPESVVLSPEEQWYTESYPDLQKQITDEYNAQRELVLARGFEEGTARFDMEMQRNTTLKELMSQRSDLYFREVLYNP